MGFELIGNLTAKSSVVNANWFKRACSLITVVISK